MSRSLKKGPYVDEKLYRKVERQTTAGNRRPIKTWARACTIVPEFVGHTFQVQQRSDVHRRLLHRGHGRPQTG